MSDVLIAAISAALPSATGRGDHDDARASLRAELAANQAALGELRAVVQQAIDTGDAWEAVDDTARSQP